ncbi:unnamed protein product [Symbiodinium natans]|uniref:Uncharacterized protein n=1 Tax=Symbiodinium natans TaxID=878477 RepID=A0A812RA93_9DINO|nr:unnamed protein product [Symbiodinium natans]
MAHASKGASVRRLSWRHWAQWADGISPWKKQVPGLCLTAALNIMDFYSDLLVVLKYGCYVEGSFTRSCGWEEVAQVALATCQPHWWWFRIGLAMLVVSNTEQSAVWAHFMALQAPPGWRGWRRVCAFAGAFMLAFFQLNYLVDVACLVYRGRRADKAGEIYTESQSESFNRAFRELVTKCLESAPQLYFQTYVLFTLGAHRDWVQAGSVAISTLSLAYGITKVWAASPIRFQSGEHLHRRLKTPRALLLIFLFLTLDQAWRAGVAALMLAEASRPIGVVVLVAFLLGFLICFMLNWRDFCKEFCHSEANLIQLFFLPIAATLAGHLMPAVLILVDELADGESMLRTASPQLAAWRWTEGVVCMAVAFAVAKTSCGEAPYYEAGLLLAFLGASALLFLALYTQCGTLRGFWRSMLLAEKDPGFEITAEEAEEQEREEAEARLEGPKEESELDVIVEDKTISI